MLDWVARQCERSVTRGIGPARQSKGYSVEAVFDETITVYPVIPDGPINAKGLLIVGAFFMTRELEVAAAKVDRVFLDSVKREVGWSLPATKTDITGNGISRKWSCRRTLPDGRRLHKPCPFCAFDGLAISCCFGHYSPRNCQMSVRYSLPWIVRYRRKLRWWSLLRRS